MCIFCLLRISFLGSSLSGLNKLNLWWPHYLLIEVMLYFELEMFQFSLILVNYVFILYDDTYSDVGITLRVTNISLPPLAQ
jgi:hypothetical protein